MKEFSTAYKETMHEASTQQITKILEKYASHNWLIADTFNTLITAFGKRFESFSYKELASFNASLGKIGLRQ